MYVSNVKLEIPPAAEPSTRDETTSGGTGSVQPFRKPGSVPRPVTEHDEPKSEAWQPPKEVIWMGNPLHVLALSKILSPRLSEPTSHHIDR